MHVRPHDVVDVADLVAEALRPAVAADWTVPAGTLEWDVETTVAHIAGSLAKYALYLSSRSTRFIALSYQKWHDATPDELLDALIGSAQAVANAATAAPEGARAFHGDGLADTEGYVALACGHLLEHAYDITQGLGRPFDPPVGICAAVLARLNPWLEAGTPPWPTLLWRLGRGELAGRPPVEPDVIGHLAPLAEWDGSVPRAAPSPILAYVYDEAKGRWLPST